ncbi:MAG: hypothetical protein CMA30_05080 [Euryarchaeota archaeon]|nr:hypothetical protein [Euryarchaeota archaeon]
MSRFLVLLLVMTILSPLSLVYAENNRDSSFAGVNSPEQIIIHRSESLEIPITIQNTEQYTQTYSLNLISAESNLTTIGLPIQYTLDSNQLRQVKFTLSCDSNAGYQTSQLSLNLTNDVNSDEYLVINIEIMVLPQSDLDFGVDGVSQFVVDPNVQTNLAVNITNNGVYSDDVTYSLTTQSSWQWGWTMNQTSGDDAFETLVSGQLAYVYLWVKVPSVIDGSPLLNTGPRFTLTATSSLDYVQSQWSFDLLMSEFRNISIDSTSENLTLDPLANDRLSVTVRNVGNLDNKIDITLEAIDELGQSIIEVPVSDRIEFNGWTVALFGAKENIALQPNEARTFEVGFQAPDEYFGSFDVRIKAYPIGAVSRTYTTDVSADIEWIRSANIELINEDCLALLPGENCQSYFTIENLGNAKDVFEIKSSDVPNFLTTDLSATTIELQKGEAKTTEMFSISSNQNVLAFENGNVTFDLIYADTKEIVQQISVPVIIAPKISWSLESIVEEVDANGRLSIAMTLRNDGNAIDGLIVQLECSHSTEMAFIPPNNAILEEGIELPRSFEINDLPLGSNFTIRAWADLPQDLSSNGTLYLNTSIRSRFAPDMPFIFTSSGDYLGESWAVDEESDSGFDIIEFASNILQITKSWSLIILSIVISGVILNKSLRDRKIRKEDEAIRQSMYQKEAPEKVQDWMEKFNQKNTNDEEVIQSKQIPADTFQNAFRAKAGLPQQASNPVEEPLRKAASMVLDVHDKSMVLDTADELLAEIKTKGIARPNVNNQSLEMKPVETSITSRKDPKNIIRKNDNSLPTNTESVPLPVTEDDDDLDF